MSGPPLARRGRGMVLGKFLPPHLGHVYLVEFARGLVEDLTVVVGTLPCEPIPGALRVAWVRELFPGVRVAHVDQDLPQQPSDHPDFWRLWKEALLAVLPQPPDYVFASDAYGAPLAATLGAEFVPVDPGRTVVPISGTRIRADPWSHWDYLPRCVRPYFARRVCVFGPESTGKTMLAGRLAAHFRTAMVPEYARTLLAAQGDRLGPEDIPRIARGQAAAEDALARNANRLLVCDTDLLTTVIWSEVLFGGCPAEVRAEAERRRYDLYLLLDVDVPYVADPQRYLPERRRWFLDRCRAELEARRRPYVLISGDLERRFREARAAVERLFPARVPS